MLLNFPNNRDDSGSGGKQEWHEGLITVTVPLPKLILFGIGSTYYLWAIKRLSWQQQQQQQQEHPKRQQLLGRLRALILAAAVVVVTR